MADFNAHEAWKASEGDWVGLELRADFLDRLEIQRQVRIAFVMGIIVGMFFGSLITWVFML